MSVKKRALGRGLDALLGAEPLGPAPQPAAATPHAAEIRKIPFVRLRPNPYQPRRHFSDEGLAELSQSIRVNGILQPIVARQRGDGFEIVAGERRWRAAQLAELTEVPVMVREFTDQEMLELSLLENLQREDLNPVEEAMAYQQLADEFHLTQEQIAERMGKSRVAVTNALRLLKLPGAIHEWIVEGRISAGHARALLGLDHEAAQVALAREIMQRGLSVREAERRVRLLGREETAATGEKSAAAGGQESSQYRDLEEKLSLHLGRKVRIVAQANNQGRVEIFFSSLDEFQGLLEQLGIPIEQEI
jgi:ParB family transcriptional regulator, chromosome partitioning protein